MAKKKFYVDTKELEEYWTGWDITGCEVAWEHMNVMIYKMCEGIATHFNPKTPEEHTEHTHDAFMLTIDKIRRGKLVNKKIAPVFNLLTTTIFRHLYSKMNKEKKRKTHLTKYVHRYISENHPEMLSVSNRGEIPLDMAVL